ncbi:F-box only protein 15-like [Stigmatopora nigra]
MAAAAAALLSRTSTRTSASATLRRRFPSALPGTSTPASAPASAPAFFLGGNNSRRRAGHLVSLDWENYYSPPSSALERLPPEILMKILSYLDGASLLMVNIVNKYFHRLSNDEPMWRRIYLSACGIHQSITHSIFVANWKKQFLWKMGGQEFCKWKPHFPGDLLFMGSYELSTFLNQNVVLWEVTLRERSGREVKPKLDSVTIFGSSVILTWRGCVQARLPYLQEITLSTAVREPRSRRRPKWRSLICRTDRANIRLTSRLMSYDAMLHVNFYPPCFLVGFWTFTGTLAFVLATLHMDNLLERCLLGSPISPYWQAVPRLPADPYSAAYSLHLHIHDTCKVLLSEMFHPLYYVPDVGTCGVTLRPIRRDNTQTHRPLKTFCHVLRGGIRMTSKSCCIMAMTLRKDNNEPLWSVATPVRAQLIGHSQSRGYFQISHLDSRGRVDMMLVHMKDRGRFMLYDMTVTCF